MAQSYIKNFSMFNLVLIALTSALGIAIKPIVVPLSQIITGPLYIPGGTVAGGFYMMWIVLGAAMVRKKGTATLIAIVQAIMVISLGILGTHGIMSFVSYIAPGLAVDLVLLIGGYKRFGAGWLFAAGVVANLCGTFIVNLIFFKLPLIPLILTLSTACLSGGLGGIIAYAITTRVSKYSLFGDTI